MLAQALDLQCNFLFPVVRYLLALGEGNGEFTD